MLYYLDASAWVKRYYNEPGAIWIHSIFDEGNTLACSTLGMVEVVGTLSRKYKSGAFSRQQIQQIYREIDADWIHFIKIQIIEQIADSAKQLAGMHALRGADAIHLSSMQFLWNNLTENGNRPIMVVSDRELKTAAISLGIEIIDPQELE